MGEIQLPQSYTATMRREFTFYHYVSRNYWYSLHQSWKDERMRWPWSHPVVLKSCINVVTTKYKLTNWDLCQSEFPVLSGGIITKLLKICFLCTYVDKMIIQQRLMFCSKFSFTIASLMFFPLFSKVFTNILKIYELPKINNMIPKYCRILVLTIIIYQANSMSQLHLGSEL